MGLVDSSAGFVRLNIEPGSVIQQTLSVNTGATVPHFRTGRVSQRDRTFLPCVRSPFLNQPLRIC